MQNDLLLTIVVPIYNVEKYLNECLDSLLNQINRGFKVILVNDGSKDSSGMIAKKYSELYPGLFRYIEQENKGLGAARNTGLSYVDTPYVKFLDSDDWILPNTVDNIVKKLEKQKYKPDICFMIPQIYNMASKSYEKWYDQDLLLDIFNNKETVSPEQDNRMYDLEPSVCRSIFSVEFLKKENFAFPEGIKWEDIEPHFILFKKARRCIYIENAGFIYRINSGSQITSGSSISRLDMIKVFSSLIYKTYNSEWEINEKAFVIKNCIKYIRWSLDCSDKEVRKELCYKAHLLLSKLPKKDVKYFKKDISINKNDRRYFKILHSSILYKILRNRHMTDFVKDVKTKVKRVIRK